MCLALIEAPLFARGSRHSFHASLSPTRMILAGWISGGVLSTSGNCLILPQVDRRSLGSTSMALYVQPGRTWIGGLLESVLSQASIPSGQLVYDAALCAVVPADADADPCRSWSNRKLNSRMPSTT